MILKIDIAAFSKLFFDFIKTLKNDLLGFAMQQERWSNTYLKIAT